MKVSAYVINVLFENIRFQLRLNNNVKLYNTQVTTYQQTIEIYLENL